MKWSQIICFLLITFFIFSWNSKIGSAQVIDGPIARQSLERTVQELFYKEKFDELEKMALEFRKTKARFPEGAWKLEFFYIGITPKEKSSEGWNRYLRIVDKWIEQNPNSITAKVVAGRSWLAYGWYARGGGYANQVSEEGWRLYGERLKKALSYLSKPEDSEDCPARYEELLRLEGWDRSQFEALFQEAVSFEPTYYSLYLRKLSFLLPKWSGEEGEWQRFAYEAVGLTPESEGKTIYMRILWSAWSLKEFNSFNEPRISWPMMKQGFLDTERNYPDSPWNLNNFCKFACFAGDKETAKQLFKRIGDQPYTQAWGERAEYEKWRKWSGVDEAQDQVP